MKNIISNLKTSSTRPFSIASLLTAAAFFVLSPQLVSCGASEQEVARTQEEILAEVDMVQAVGKVMPEGDWATLSSPVSARILELRVQEGDPVEEGQVLLVLESGTADLGLDEIRARLRSLEAEQQSTQAELEKARVRAEELSKVYQTSQQLFTRQAETRERVEADYSNWQQQEQVVKGLEQNLRAQTATQQEQRIQLRRSEEELGDFQLRAPRSGLLTELRARVGQTAAPSEELARIVDPTQTYVEAEVDELFAQDVREGMPVWLFSTGRQDTLARGEVVYASPVLSDKSILYETANEGEDRRVRRIRIAVEGQKALIINSKVDVQIQIK